MTIKLKARNYRGLRRMEWSPSGVCVLAGPNGSGKTTLLRLFDFFRIAYERGLPAAVDSQGGAWGLRHFQAREEDPVEVAIAVDQLAWELQLSIRGASIDPRSGECVRRLDDLSTKEFLLRRAPFSDIVTSSLVPNSYAIDGEKVGLRVLYDPKAERVSQLTPLVKAVESFRRVYGDYNINHLRRNGSIHSSDLYLDSSGENAFSVLRNWRDRREGRTRYDFVLNGLRSAFPEFFDDLEFVGAGQTISVNLFAPKSDRSVPIFFAPNGLLTGLLHLCAVAGTQPASLVAIDEMENSLHPFAIRQLTAAFREWSEEYDVTVCLATHSPVLLDEFKEEPARVFIMEHGQERLPVPLTELRDKEWLAQFSLGRLYAHGEFGSQLPESASSSAG
jgi:predicted ATPase